MNADRAEGFICIYLHSSAVPSVYRRPTACIDGSFLPPRGVKYREVRVRQKNGSLNRHDEGLRMLRECHRILSPGGKIRIATPDLLKFIGLFQSERTDAMRAYMEGKAAWHGWAKGPSPSFILNAEMRGAGHQFLYDPATLTSRLSEAGFRDIRQCTPGSSDDAELRGIDLRHNIALHPISDYETMVFEASRP